jgi:hypothetical protein
MPELNVICRSTPLARAAWIGPVLCMTLATACGGASFQDGVYQGEHARYRVGPLDRSWHRVTVDGNDLAFHRAGTGTISVNATCTEYEDVPATALVNHLLFETTERNFLLEEVVTLDGRGARHVLVQAALDGVPLELELFVLKKDGCVFDLSNIRERNAPPEVQATFLAFVQRFAVLDVNLND